MGNRLFGRMFVGTALLVMIGFVLMVALSAFSFSNRTENERHDAVLDDAKAIAESLMFIDSDKMYSDDVKRIAVACSNSSDSTVFFVNRSGLVTVCSETLNRKNCIHTGKTLKSQIVNDVFVKALYDETGDLDGLFNGNHYIVGVPIVSNEGNFETAVFVSVEVQEHYDIYLETFAYSLIPASIILVVVWIVLFLMSRNTMRPLKEMAEAAKAMANGDFSKRVVTKRKDEIGRLAESFNSMADSLSSLDYMSSSFVTNVSHDLKTPMTTISGFVDGILDGTIPDQMHKKYLSIVSVEVKRLSNTVNTMLELSKIESGMSKINLVPVDLFDLICRVAISFEYSLGDKDIVLLGLEDGQRIVADCDERMIYQVIYNLFDNAVKFTQRGGYISVSFAENNSDVMLYIKNSGEGISQKDIPHIFERFYKSDKSRSNDKNGTGVGLYIVKNIVSNHGGDITVKSVEGQYTEFCITLKKPHNTGVLRVKDESTGAEQL